MKAADDAVEIATLKLAAILTDAARSPTLGTSMLAFAPCSSNYIAARSTTPPPSTRTAILCCLWQRPDKHGSFHPDTPTNERELIP